MYYTGGIGTGAPCLMRAASLLFLYISACTTNLSINYTLVPLPFSCRQLCQTRSIVCLTQTPLGLRHKNHEDLRRREMSGQSVLVDLEFHRHKVLIMMTRCSVPFIVGSKSVLQDPSRLNQQSSVEAEPLNSSSQSILAIVQLLTI